MELQFQLIVLQLVSLSLVLCIQSVNSMPTTQQLQEEGQEDLAVGCEIFERPKFEGETLRLENHQEIPNLLELIENKWENGNKHSVKLFGSCHLISCTEPKYRGACKTFNQTRKVVLQSRLVSVLCRCPSVSSLEDQTTLLNNETIEIGDSVPISALEKESINSSITNNEEPEVVPKDKKEVGNGVGEETGSETYTSEASSDEPVEIFNQTVMDFQNFARFGKKIIGVARNYMWNKTSLAQIVEQQVAATKPLFFLKPTTSYLLEGNPIKLPQNVGKIYYEVELGVVIGKKGGSISVQDALGHVAGYFLALDITAKDLLRVYHDAIYEEEYGSSQEGEPDCCRSRGLSALLCWCLSVLILIGLAASIIISVFFILKSRTFIGKPTESGVIITDEDNSIGILTTTSKTIDDLELLYGTAATKTTTQNKIPIKHDDNVLEQESSSDVHDFVIPSPKSFTPAASPSLVPKVTSTSTVSTSTATANVPTITQTLQITPIQPAAAPAPPPIPNTNFNNNNNRHYPSYTSSISPVINYKSVIVQSEPAKTGTSSTSTSTATTTARKAYNELIRSTTQNSNEVNHRGSSSSTKAKVLKPANSKNSKELNSSSPLIQLILDAINSLQEGATLHEDDLPPSLSKDVLEQLKGINKSHYYTTKGNQHQQQQDGDEQSSNESLEKLIRTIIAANGDNNSSGEQKKKHSSSTENLRPRPNRNHFDDEDRYTSKEKHSSQHSHEHGTSNNNNAPGGRRGDLLSQIIRNMAPRFKNNKDKSYSSKEKTTRHRITTTEPTTTITTTKETTLAPKTTRTNHDIIFVTPSSARFDNNEAKTIRAGSGNGIEIVQPPNFTWGPSNDNESMTTQQYLDVLVQSQDPKTLITKQTPDGIVTSVILPPWYDNETFDEFTSTKGFNSNLTSITTTTTTNRGEDEDDPSQITMPTTTYSPPSLGDFFRNLFRPVAPETTSTVGNSFSPGPNNINNDQSSKEYGQIKRRINKPTTTSVSTDGPGADSPITVTVATERFHKTTDNGKTDIYGYFPQSDEIMHYSADSSRVPIPVLPETSQELDDDMKSSPSHVIDIQYDGKTQPEIVIENTEDEEGQEEEEEEEREQVVEESRNVKIEADHSNNNAFGGYLNNEEQMVTGSSSIRPQIVSPPSSTSDLDINVAPTGGGIRNPVNYESDTTEESASSVLNDLLKKNLEEVEDEENDENISNKGAEEIQSLEKLEEEISAESEEEEAEPSNNMQINRPNSTRDGINRHRQPVRQLDKQLYPIEISKPTIEQINAKNSEEAPPSTQKVYEVYAVKYTTESPTKNLNAKNSYPNEFKPPEPINFHSNRLSFSPPETSNGFIPSGGAGYHPESWRPLAYENDQTRDRISRPQRGPGSVAIQVEPTREIRTRTSTQRSYTHLEDFSPSPVEQQSKHQHHNRRPNLQLTRRPDEKVETNDAYDEEDKIDVADSNMNLWVVPSTTTTESPPTTSRLPIRPSQPIPAPVPIPHPLASNNNNNHFVQYQKQPFVKHLLPVQSHDHHHGLVDHVFHHPHQQQHPHQPPHTMIDRSKYKYRPAPPPIVMRRNPPPQHPYFLERNQLIRSKPSSPNLNQQQQQQQYLSNQQLLLRQQQHLHQQLTKRGNLNQWPNNNNNKNEFDQENNRVKVFNNNQNRRQGVVGQ